MDDLSDMEVHVDRKEQSTEALGQAGAVEERLGDGSYSWWRKVE